MGNDSQRYYAPRTSTPEPVSVPRWDDEPTEFAFDSLLADYQPGTFAEREDVAAQMPELDLGLPGLQLSLSGLGMGLAKSPEWQSRFQKAPEYTSSNAKDILSRINALEKSGGGAFSGKKGGGYGLSAYGYSGNSGVKGTRGTAQYGLNAKFWDALGAANAAMRAAGLGTFGITDGWRSYESQVDLKKRKPGLAATPGRSVHGIGLASDLRFTPAQAKWMQANASKFGLIVPMPGKEPWHVQWDPSRPWS